MKDEELVTALAKAEGFRLGSCEVESMQEHDWESTPSWDKLTDDERDLYRRSEDYFDNHYLSSKGVAWFIEERDSKGLWRTIGFGTGGRPFKEQCREIVGHMLRRTYIFSCANGFRDWSRVPKAKTREELALKLATAGII